MIQMSDFFFLLNLQEFNKLFEISCLFLLDEIVKKLTSSIPIVSYIERYEFYSRFGLNLI